MRKGLAAIFIVLFSAAIFKSFIAPNSTFLQSQDFGRQISSNGLHIATGSATKSIPEELIPLP